MMRKAPAKKEATRPEPSAGEKMNAFGVERVCERIGDEVTITDLAAEIGVSKGAFLAWIEADTVRSSQVREARRMMARIWDEKAETVIREAKNDFQLKKARDLAHHYRWRASKIAPKEYGDKVALTGGDGGPIKTDATLDVTGLSIAVMAEIMAARDAAGVGHG